MAVSVRDWLYTNFIYYANQLYAKRIEIANKQISLLIT